MSGHTNQLGKDVTALLEEGGDYPKDPATLIKNCGGKCIQCCLDSWNGLCPGHPLTNVTEVTHQKRWLLFGHDTTVLEEVGGYGEISKIAFEVNGHLTAKALQQNSGSPVIVLNCRIWWQCGIHHQVHDWLKHITMDVEKCCVENFPEIVPPASCYMSGSLRCKRDQLRSKRRNY